jgi:hypothetical protein
MDVDECASSPCVIDFNSLQRGDYFCPCNTGYSGQNCSGDVDSIYGSSTTAQLSLRTTHDAVLWITTTALVGSSVSGNAYYCSFVAIAVLSLLPVAKAMDPEAVAETVVAPILAAVAASCAIGGAAVVQVAKRRKTPGSATTNSSASLQDHRHSNAQDVTAGAASANFSVIDGGDQMAYQTINRGGTQVTFRCCMLHANCVHVRSVSSESFNSDDMIALLLSLQAQPLAQTGLQPTTQLRNICLGQDLLRSNLGADLGVGVMCCNGVPQWSVGDRLLEASWEPCSILSSDLCVRAVAAAAGRCHTAPALNTPVRIIVTQTDAMAAASAHPCEIWRVSVVLRGDVFGHQGGGFFIRAPDRCNTKIYVLHIVQLQVEVRSRHLEGFAQPVWTAMDAHAQNMNSSGHVSTLKLKCLDALHAAAVTVSTQTFGSAGFSVLQLPNEAYSDKWHQHANIDSVQWPVTDSESAHLATTIRQLPSPLMRYIVSSVDIVMSSYICQDNVDAVILQLLSLPEKVVVCWRQQGVPLLYLQRPGHQRAQRVAARVRDQRLTQEILVVCCQLDVETLRMVCVRARHLGCSVSSNITEQSSALFKCGFLENPLPEGPGGHRTVEAFCFSCKLPISPLRPPAAPAVCEFCHHTVDSLMCTPCALQNVVRHNLPIPHAPHNMADPGRRSRLRWKDGAPQVQVICQKSLCKCGRTCAAEQTDKALGLQPQPSGTAHSNPKLIMAAGHLYLLRSILKDCARPPTAIHVLQFLLLVDIVKAAGNLRRITVPCGSYHLVTAAKTLAGMLRDLSKELVTLLNTRLFRDESGIHMQLCRDRAMDPSCRKALRHFVNVLHASVPLWHTGNLPDLVKSLTQPAESGNWTPLQEAQEADITTGITTPSDLVRVYVLEKMTTATRAAASQAIEGLLNMSSTNLCCAIQMAMHNLVVLPSFGPIPADWWDADKEEAEAAPTAIAADLFKPQTTWWLSSDSNIGSCLLWTFQLHDAHNRAEVLYEYFVDKLSSQVFRSTSQRVRDAAVQRWAEMGRDGQSTRTVACPLLTQAGVEPWQHLPCPELQAQTLCSATLVHVLEIVMAHEPALCDPGRYDRFPWARSTQQRPARSGEDLVLMLLYMQQQRLDSMPFSISGAFGVRLCVHLAGWRFAQAVEQSWNGNRTLDWYRHVRRLAEGAAREDELVSRLLYGRGHERDSSTIDLDWIDISWEPQRMKPAIEWLRRAPVTSALLCCSNDELDSLVYLGRFVQSWTEWPHGKKQTWSRAQESLTATQIAELHQDQLNSVVALLVERIDKDHCKDHCSVVFVRNGSSCKRFLLLDHIIPAGSPVLLDAGEVARYLRGCHAHYAAQTIAIVYFRHYNHILSDSSSCNSEYDSSSHNTGYTFSFNPSPQDMHQRECQLELAKNPVGSSPFATCWSRRGFHILADDDSLMTTGAPHRLLKSSQWSAVRSLDARWAAIFSTVLATEAWKTKLPWMQISTAVSSSDASTCSRDQVWSIEPRDRAMAKDTLAYQAYLKPAANRFETAQVSVCRRRSYDDGHYTRPAVNRRQLDSAGSWGLAKQDPGFWSRCLSNEESSQLNECEQLRTERCSHAPMDQVAGRGWGQGPVTSNAPFAMDVSAFYLQHPDKCELTINIAPHAVRARFHPVAQLRGVISLVTTAHYLPNQEGRLAARLCRTVFNDEAVNHDKRSGPQINTARREQGMRRAAVHEAERLGVYVKDAWPHGHQRSGHAVLPDVLMPARQETCTSMMQQITTAFVNACAKSHPDDPGWTGLHECGPLIEFFIGGSLIGNDVGRIPVPEQWTLLPPLIASWTELPSISHGTRRRQYLLMLEHTGANPCTPSDQLHRPSRGSSTCIPQFSQAVTQHTWFVSEDTPVLREFTGPLTQRQAKGPQITPPMKLHAREGTFPLQSHYFCRMLITCSCACECAGDITLFAESTYRADACLGGMEVHISSALPPHTTDELPQSDVWRHTRQYREDPPPGIDVPSKLPAHELRAAMLAEFGTRHGAFYQARKMTVRRERLLAQSWPEASTSLTLHHEITSFVSRSVESEHWGVSQAEVRAQRGLWEAGLMQKRHVRDAISTAGHQATGAETLADLARCRHHRCCEQKMAHLGRAPQAQATRCRVGEGLFCSVLKVLLEQIGIKETYRQDPASCFFVAHREGLHVGQHSRLPHRTCECCSYELSEFPCANGVLFFLSLTCKEAKTLVDSSGLFLKPAPKPTTGSPRHKRRCGV